MGSYDVGIGLMKGLESGMQAYEKRKGLLEQKKEKEQDAAEKALQDRLNKKLEFKAKGFDVVEDEMGDIVDIVPMSAQMKPLTEQEKLNLKKTKMEIEEKAKNASILGNEGQVKAAGFGRRLQQAEDIFSQLEKGGYDRTSIEEAAKAKASKVLPSQMKKQLSQQEQAERNFVNAVLRRESGAAISPSEFSNAEEQYFPRYGDSPETIEQKRKNRQQVYENLKAEAGPAFEKVPYVGVAPVDNKAPSGLLKPAQAEASTRVRVKKGNEVLEIDRSDLPSAQAEGYLELK
jgi:hypothetical protein